MDLDIYTTEMSKSVWDKAFFMDKIPGAKYVIDFGCADGAMIHYLAPLFPDITFVGYDINDELINRARNRTPFYANEIYFTNIEAVIAYTQCKPAAKSEEICINFSSVLHEVYSSTGGIGAIHDLIEELQPRYITIRDMYCDEHLPFTTPTYDEVWGPLPALQTRQFEKTFGPLTDWRDMTHFLMKLQWIDNGWDEEMEEDYYSWTIEKFLDDIGGNYIPEFECKYQLPYLGEKWKNAYNWYNPDIHTHAQFILRRDD
jgi:SAM-dependent methyltransferase